LRGDFRVFDNDRPQKIRLDAEPLPVSVAQTVQANHGALVPAVRQS